MIVKDDSISYHSFDCHWKLAKSWWCGLSLGLCQTNMFYSNWRRRFVGQSVSSAIQNTINIMFCDTIYRYKIIAVLVIWILHLVILWFWLFCDWLCSPSVDTQENNLVIYSSTSWVLPVEFCRDCRVNIFTWAHKTQSEILWLWLFCFCSNLQDGFPIRIKAVNIINEPRIFKGIFAIIKPFLKEKMAERVTIVLELSLTLLFFNKGLFWIVCLPFIRSLYAKTICSIFVLENRRPSIFFSQEWT